MEIPQSYEGREHSLIKHELLKGYLEKLLFIKVMSGTRDITYVDCFAGPWGDETGSLSGTSIAISLEILSKVQKTLTDRHNIRGTKFRAIYVEENKKSYKRLSEYLQKSSPDGIECHALCGDYSAMQDKILELCGDQSFAFFFIDPKGWLDVGVTKLTKLLRRQQSEFLITFMYDFLNRAIGMPDYRVQVSQMLGDLSEHDYIELDRLSAKERADGVVRKYREQLKVSMGPDGRLHPRSFHANVLHKDKNRVLYHLVYLTRHHKGIVEFAEASEKVASIQKVVRIQKKLDASNQSSFISAEEQVLHQGVEQKTLDDVKAYWLAQLKEYPVKYDNTRLADMLENTDWLTSDLQRAFGDLLAEKKVKNCSYAGGKRTRLYIHFDKGEQLMRCT